MAKTILGLGAHYDDCVFGISGTLLNAVRKNYRVVIVSLIGDYSNWKPAAGRHEELVRGSVELAKEYGVEMRFLNFTGMRFDVTEATKRAVAEVVGEVVPDVAFQLWPHDTHPDHEAASRLCKIALRHGDRVLPAGSRYQAARRIYHYDNGPRHTIGFEPNTFVDITDEWRQATEWLGRLMALVRGDKYDPNREEPAVRAKTAITQYRGATCGVRYAEAFRAESSYAQEVF